MNEIKETKEFYKQLFMKTLATFGFTFFSVLISLNLAGIDKVLIVFYTSAINAGLYFFTEMMKYYKLQPQMKVTSKNKPYNFLI